MDKSWWNYPVGVFMSAAETVFGKVALFYVALSLGSGLGAFIGSWSIAEGIAGLIAMPSYALVAIFKSVGIVVLPLCLLTFILVVRAGLDWKWILLPGVFFSYLTYDILSWEYDPDRPLTKSEKFQQEMQQHINDAIQKGSKERE